MKVPKIVTAGLLALSTAGIVNAQTVVHMTGSTAFRAAVHQAIADVLDPGQGISIAYVNSGSSGLPGASAAIFTGYLYATNGGGPVVVKTYWSGSVGGVQTVSQQMALANAWLTNTSPGTTAGNNVNGSAVYDPAAVPEVCMSDVAQISTPFPTPALVDQVVAVVPFKWVRNNGSPSTFSNMTPQLANALYAGSGSLPLALFTGLPTDQGTNVYALGRNADSGTRLTAFAETGVGVFNSVQQYYPLNGSTIIKSGGTLVVTGQELVPQDTVNGITYPPGNSGYSSGGDLAAALKATGSATASGVKGFYVAYLGLSDAYTAIAGGAVELPYNGTYYSTNAVQEGQYTFWGYEHLDYRTGYSGIGQKVANLIANKIYYQDADIIPSTGNPVAAGIRTVFMNASRQTDGGTVSNFGY
jgi:hypothetical protein